MSQCINRVYLKCTMNNVRKFVQYDERKAALTSSDYCRRPNNNSVIRCSGSHGAAG
nr:MAG TPA: hypothetical protein [Caudoviricetes sp.]